MSPSVLKQALLDAQQGNGIAPNASQTLIDKGWAEWVDYEHGTLIDENHPRSVLRLTATGVDQLGVLESSTAVEQVASPKAPQAMQSAKGLSPGFAA
jgi:hypothetical protein